MGRIAFLVEVELMWVQDPGSSPKSLRRFLTNTLNVSHKTKVSRNKIITHINFLEKQLLWPVLIFY